MGNPPFPPSSPPAQTSGPCSQDGHSLAGRRFGNFIFHEAVWENPSGVVYRATALAEIPQSQAYVHVLSAPRDDSAALTPGAGLPSIATMPTHPNLLRVLASGVIEGQTYLAYEWAEGKPLTVAVRDRLPLSYQETLSLGLQALRASAALHESGIPHGSLSAHAFLLTPEGVLKLMGFQPRAAVDERSDQFGLGCILFWLRFGSPPAIPDWKRYDRATSPLRGLALYGDQSQATLSLELRRILERLLEPDPTDRFPSMMDALRDLEHVPSISCGPVLKPGEGRLSREQIEAGLKRIGGSWAGNSKAKRLRWTRRGALILLAVGTLLLALDRDIEMAALLLTALVSLPFLEIVMGGIIARDPLAAVWWSSLRHAGIWLWFLLLVAFGAGATAAWFLNWEIPLLLGIGLGALISVGLELTVGGPARRARNV
ncbi:MAG: hypothetical protein V2A74_08895 [bacterium]